MVAELLQVAGAAGKVSGADKSSTLTAASSATSGSGNIDSKFSTGSFNVGGGGNINTLFIIAGIIALTFVLKEFFLRKK